MTGLYFDLQKAARDKSKLVYVQRTVNKNGKTFQQGFWVSPSQVKATDNVLQGQSVLSAYQAAQKQQATQSQQVGNFDRTKYLGMYTSGDKKGAMKYAKDNGISWNEHQNPNINWMRCQMAVNKALGGSNYKENHCYFRTLNTSGLSSDFDTKPKKDKIVELLKQNSRDSLMSFAKDNGISWKENSNPGINWMRASMAIQKYLETHNIVGSNNKNVNQDSKQNIQPKPDTLEVPIDATSRQKALIGMINTITKKEDFDLFGSVGMIAEDDEAREFLEKKLKPAYDEWKNGHKPNSGNYGFLHSYASSFGKSASKELGNETLKGLNTSVTQALFSRMFDSVSLGVMLYPREMLSSNVFLGRPDDFPNQTAKLTCANLISPSIIINNLNNAFSTRKVNETKDFQYDGWDSEVYKRITKTEEYGFVRALNHISKSNPDLSNECDRMKSIFDEMMNLCDNNPKILGILMDTDTYSYIETTKDSYTKEYEIQKLLINFCEENSIPKDKIRATLYNSSDLSKLQIYNNIYDYAPTNPATYDLLKYLTDHSSDYPHIDSTNLSYTTLRNQAHTIQNMAKGESNGSKYLAEAYQKMTSDKWCAIKRKTLELFNSELEQFDMNSNKTIDWDNADVFKRKLKPDTKTDAVLGNLMFINSCNSICNSVQTRNGVATRPSKANNNGLALSNNFNYYSRTSFSDWNIFDMQEKTLSISEVNDAVVSQLDNIPTFSEKWFEKSKKYVEANGDASFKSSYFSKDPSTPEEKSYAKAYSLDLGTQSSILSYMGTPTGDLVMNQLNTVARYCPQMVSKRNSTPQKIQDSLKKKLGYSEFSVADDASQSQNNQSDLRKNREELYRKVHCSLKSCSQVQYDAIQTDIKHNWDKGKRDSSGRRLYGHISAVFNAAYKVNNSLQEQLMLENAKKLGETPQSFYHGTNHSGACGIVGVDGRFRAPKSSADASKQGLKYAGGMLGSGVYLAKMAGKSAGYFSNWGSGYNKDGCLLMCKAVLGNTYVSSGFNSSAPSNYDTVSMQAGTNTGQTTLRADEWCVRNPDFVFPEYIVDMGTKSRT